MSSQQIPEEFEDSIHQILYQHFGTSIFDDKNYKKIKHAREDLIELIEDFFQQL